MTPLEQTSDDGARILIAEDDENIRNLVSSYLRVSGYRTEAVADGPAALARMSDGDGIDLVILDLMLPGTSGLEVCREIRKAHTVPVLMLTALGDEDDRVRGFEFGADDYVVKPFSPRELVARVRAILRRGGGAAAGEARPGEHAKNYPIQIDWDGKACTFKGEAINLTQSEFIIVAALLRRPGVVFSRDELIDLLYPAGGTVVPKAVDVHMHNIRAKLGAEGAALIQTVRSFGYRAAKATAR
ncbi:MAG: response regulator transcription factor [Alphaproteobacteria bacterium]